MSCPLPGDSGHEPAESNIVRAAADSLCECCGDAAYYVLNCQGDEALDFCADCAVSLLTEGSRATWEALTELIAAVSAPTGRLRMEGHRDGDVLYDAVKKARASLEPEC